MTPQMKALARAAQLAGGLTALAADVHVAASAPSMWKQRGKVPAEHCPMIELTTGVRCEELRPDVPWHVLRTGFNPVASDTAAA